MSPARRQALLRLMVLPCILGLTGCGSTVAPGTTGATGNTTALTAPGSGMSLPTQSSATTAGGGALAPGSVSAPGALAGTTGPGSSVLPGGSGSGTAPSGPAGGPAATQAVRRGYGFDATHIYVGVGTSDDASSYAASLGLNVNVGDAKGQAKAMIQYFNHRGGLAGRQIVPVWHDISSANYNADPSGAAQSECADWTQDHHVFAAVNALSYPDNAIACLAHAHTIAITTGAAGPVVSAELDRYSPFFYAPGMADTGHFVGPFVDALVREHYFTGWDTGSGGPGKAPVKVGLMYAADRPDVLSLTQHALAAHGMKVDDSFYLASTADDSQIAGAVLRFKAEGITHVITDGFLSVLPRIAEGQGYHPRYGVSSWDGFALSVSSSPSDQLVGAVGVGWTPLEDVDASHDPGEGAAEKQCIAIMKRAGQDTSNRGVRVTMASTCEQFFLLRDAILRAQSLVITNLQSGLESLGTSFGSALTFGERFGPGRHAGVAAFRPVRFDPRCTCFAYNGDIQTYP